MVSFEEIREEETTPGGDITHNKDEPNTGEKEQDEEVLYKGWTKLMGKDLVIRPVQEFPKNTAVQPHDCISIDFVGRAAADPTQRDGPVFQNVSDWRIVVGEKDVVPAVELGARFMHEGETALVWSHSKYAHGVGQRQHEGYVLPSNSHVLYEITVRRIVPADERTSVRGQVATALSRKVIGNDIYMNEWYGSYGPQRAKQEYKRAAETMLYLLQQSQDENNNSSDDNDDDDDDDSDQEALLEQARVIMLDCLNNIAALHLRAREYKLAKEAAVKVLTHEPANFKALIRAAKAALLDPASSYEEVDAAIQAAAEQSQPTNGDVAKLKAEFRKRKKAYEAKSKEMFSKIGASIGKERSSGNDESRDTDAKKQEDALPTVPSAPHGEEAKDEKQPWWNWREWDWKNKIFPYGFQLILPFITYYIFTVMKRKAELQEAASES